MDKINFVNNQAPALNATNLNQLQTNVENFVNERISTLTPDRVLVSDSNRSVTASLITKTELDSLGGVTGNVQEQINGINNELVNKQAAISSGTALPATVTDGAIFLLYS